MLLYLLIWYPFKISSPANSAGSSTSLFKFTIAGGVCRLGQHWHRRRHQAEREQPVGQPRPASAASADPLAAGAGVPRTADHAERTHQEEARGAEGKLQVIAHCIVTDGRHVIW